MQHHVSDDRTKLTFTIDESEQALIRELIEENAEDPDYIRRDNTMYDWFEGIMCNSELSWTSSDLTGDLTYAPMICIFGDTMALPKGLKKWDLLQGTRLSGCWDDTIWVDPILERWAYMNYAVRSPMEDLLEYGKTTFVGGEYYDKDKLKNAVTYDHHAVG